MTEKTLAGRFLVATPSMKDPFFSKTVILLVGHNAGTGALGLVLNRESSVTMEEACRQLGFECTADPSARLGWAGAGRLPIPGALSCMRRPLTVSP